jgi:tryptophan synthase alpha chain
VFFPDRPAGAPGLAVFLNAGDPSLDVLPDLVQGLDEARVDCLELAVPFPDSPTDGPVVRRSAQRALAGGVGLAEVLDVVRAVRPGLRHLRIALLVDWRHTVRGTPLTDFLPRVRDCGADGLLVHGMPPRVRPGYHAAAQRAGLPIVTTCYADSAREVLVEAMRHASAYLYLVAHRGRTGTAPAAGYQALTPVLRTLRQLGTAPVAVGFGVRTRADLQALHCLGADAAIVGSAGVARIERALEQGHDVIDDYLALVRELRPGARPAVSGRSAPTPDQLSEESSRERTAK